jgi:hypothetical protein
MRCFDVSVSGNKIVCKPDTFHVPPNIHEDIAVCLHDSLVGKYELSVRLQHGKFLTKQDLNSSMIVLHDHHTGTKGEDKFTIRLDPIAPNKDKVPDLDPRVVND